MASERGHFDWEDIYTKNPFDKLGWHYPSLDPDLEEALETLKECSGTFLDLGSGSGTQTAELHKKGFTVTGIDISKTAVEKAALLYGDVEFIHDDIFNSKLSTAFDYVFDRGCFHNLEEALRESYVNSVHQLIKPTGTLFLKCFAANPDIEKGPYQFTMKMIEQVFKDAFEIERFKHTVYQGQLQKDPKALFIVMKKKSRK